MSYDAESELHQKLLIIDSLPGKHSITNISVITNATRQTKYFSGPFFLWAIIWYISLREITSFNFWYF